MSAEDDGVLRHAGDPWRRWAPRCSRRGADGGARGAGGKPPGCWREAFRWREVLPGPSDGKTTRRAHKEGQLVEWLTDWLPAYRYKASNYTERMKDIVRHGAPLWEEVVAAQGKPWSPYIESEQRRLLLKVVANIHADIERGKRLAEKLRRQHAAREANGPGDSDDT